MFCPQCGSTQSDELKFCKSCGANLQALRQIMATRDSDDKFDWSKTWVADMFMSGDEAVKKAAEIERLQGKTPEVKRRNEIKAGVITSSVGVGLMVVLSILMEGLIISGRLSDVAAEIVSRIWIVGLIPLLVGIALIINGMFISRKGGELDVHRTDEAAPEPKIIESPNHSFLSPKAETSQLPSDIYSVTDETTKHLKTPLQKPDR